MDICVIVSIIVAVVVNQLVGIAYKNHKKKDM